MKDSIDLAFQEKKSPAYFGRWFSSSLEVLSYIINVLLKCPSLRNPMQLQALPREKNEADQDRLKTRLSQLYHDKLLKVKAFLQNGMLCFSMN